MEPVNTKRILYEAVGTVIEKHSSSILVVEQIQVFSRDTPELHSLYRSPNLARVIKSRRLRWAGHIAGMEEGRSAFKILTGKHKGQY